MLKGIAHGGGGDSSGDHDRHGIVLALSQLSRTLTSAETDAALAAAAETAAALLRVNKTMIFTKQGRDELQPAADVGVGSNVDLISATRDIARATIGSSAPLVISNTFADSSHHCKILSNAKIISVICVPMRVNDASVGAIVAMSEDMRAFSPGDIELLHVVASQAALAVLTVFNPEQTTSPNDDLIRLADRKIRDLSTLNQVSDAMSSTLDLDRLLDIALEQSLAAVDADAGSLMLVNEDTDKLEIAASRGLARELVEKTCQQVGNSIAGWVAQHGESVLVTDAQNDSRFKMPFVRESITSSASVPLKTKGAVIGVLNVNTIKADRIFDERDLELLGTIANQMAVAIENARLYARVNRRTQQLGSLLQISKTVTSTLNLDEVLRRLSDEVCALFQMDVCALLLLDELSGRMRFGHGCGLKTRRKYTYYDLAAPLASRVKVTGKKLVAKDISASRSLRTDASEVEGLRAAVCIPLKNGGKMVGMAVAFAHEPRVFPKSQLDIMRPLGELAGVAVHNARVYRRKYKIAEILQQRLVPSNIPAVDGLDIGHKFLPAREVGGDYYDFFKVGSGSVGIVLADVSGSDVEAAEYTTMGKHFLRAYARDCESPATVLTKTNDLICESTSAEVFISSFYGVLNPERMTLRYASAGCEPAVYYRAKDKSVSSLVADGILLGIKRGAAFEECVVELGEGDVVVLFTDGLTEACKDGRRFGTASVQDVVASSAELTAQEIVERIHDALLEFAHGRVSDDVAMVVLKVP